MQSAEEYARLAEGCIEYLHTVGDISTRKHYVLEAQVYATLAQAAAIAEEKERVQPTDTEMVCQIYGFLSQLQKEGANISDYVAFMRQLCEAR